MMISLAMAAAGHWSRVAGFWLPGHDAQLLQYFCCLLPSLVLEFASKKGAIAAGNIAMLFSTDAKLD